MSSIESTANAPETPSFSNPYVVTLPPGQFPGAAIAYDGWTGLRHWDPFWLQQGYDSLIVRGHGDRDTHIVAPKIGEGGQRAQDTLVLGKGAGPVRFENLTVHTGSRRAIFAGADHRPQIANPTFGWLEMVNCDMVSETRCAWGIHAYHYGGSIEHCDWHLSEVREHGLYAHGWGYPGWRVKGLHVHSVGSECLKFTRRPHEAAWIDAGLPVGRHAEAEGVSFVPRTAITIADCVLEGYANGINGDNGAGIVMQGVGCTVSIRGVHSVNSRRPAIAIDDGSEWYSYSGVAGSHPAIDLIEIRECVLGTGSGPVLRVLSAEGLEVRDCALYGLGDSEDPVRAHLENIESATVVGCNMGLPKQVAEQRGLNLSREAMLQPDWVPASRGFEGAID